MKKMVLLVLLSVMSVGVAADNAHAIFGGRAWRATARQEGYGVFGLRLNKSGRFFRRSASIEQKAPDECGFAAADSLVKDWKFLGLRNEVSGPIPIGSTEIRNGKEVWYKTGQYFK